MLYVQPVDRNDLGKFSKEGHFKMIDNYVYLYHTDTLIVLPLYPESIQDSMSTTFTPNTPLLRSAPIYSYTNSGPRSLQIDIPLHRDMMNDINISTSRFLSIVPELSSTDYVDLIINQLQAAALPKYGASSKMVNPPIVAVKFGNSIFCKGVVDGGVTVTHSGPILSGTDKYALAQVSFSLKEIDPYDADTVMLEGGFRGIKTSLERNIFNPGAPSPVPGGRPIMMTRN